MTKDEALKLALEFIERTSTYLPTTFDSEGLNIHATIKAALASPVAIPLESSEEAAKAIQAMLAEYRYPSNPTNAARAGWRAARLYTTPPSARRQWVEVEKVKWEGDKLIAKLKEKNT